MKIGMRIDSIDTCLMFDDMRNLQDFMEKVHACVEKEFENETIKISCNKKWTYYDTFYDCIQENWGYLIVDNYFTINFGYTEPRGDVDTTFNTIETLQLFLIMDENKSIKTNCEKFYRIDD